MQTTWWIGKWQFLWLQFLCIFCGDLERRFWFWLSLWLSSLPSTYSRLRFITSLWVKILTCKLQHQKFLSRLQFIHSRVSDPELDFCKKLYFPTYVRGSSFLIGIILGFMFHNRKTDEIVTSQVNLNATIWFVLIRQFFHRQRKSCVGIILCFLWCLQSQSWFCFRWSVEILPAMHYFLHSYETFEVLELLLCLLFVCL